jgi:hypothetical protein
MLHPFFYFFENEKVWRFDKAFWQALSAVSEIAAAEAIVDQVRRN